MRFNQPQITNLAAAARPVVRNTDAAFSVSERTKTRADDLVAAAATGRSRLKETGMRVDGALDQQSMTSQTDLQNIDVARKTNKKITEIYKPARRMAGIAALAGIGKEAVLDYVDRKEKEAYRTRLEASQNETNRLLTDLIKQISTPSTLPEADPGPVRSDFDSPPGPDELMTDPSPVVTGGGGGNSGGAQSLDPNKGAYIEPTGLIRPTASFTYDQAQKWIKKVGGTDDEARTLAAIAMSESGGDSNNSTLKSGLVNRAGERSFGAWQINMTGPLRLERMQAYGLKGEEDLFDPLVNARVALALARTPNGYNHWTDYGNNNYRKYLR